MVIAGGNGVKFLQKLLIGLCFPGMKAGPAAALSVFVINAVHIRTIEMNPPELPQVIGGPVRIGSFAVQKDTVTSLQGISFLVVFQRTITGTDEKEQVGGQMFSSAGVRFLCFQGTGLLKMEQVCPGKRRGGI